jgi:hypothetical protein
VLLNHRHRIQHLSTEIDNQAYVLLTWQPAHRVERMSGAVDHVAVPRQAECPL